MPAGTAAIVASKIAYAAQKGLSLNKERMPEIWYEKVINESSDQGKVFLGEKLKRNGYVTVAQAAEWLEIESKQHQTEAATSTAKASLISTYETQPTLTSKITSQLKAFASKVK